MTIPVPQVPSQPAPAAPKVDPIAGVILRTPKARKVASGVLGAAGIVLTGVAQTVSILAQNHILPPDPIWLQVSWQWFALAAAAGGFTWNANVR